MGVYTFTMCEFTSTIAPSRLFQAFCVDLHDILPKAAPGHVKCIEFVKGDSTTVGCIKRINLPVGAPRKYLLNRLDVIDPVNFFYKYTSIGGDVLPDSLECIEFENKIESNGTETWFKVVAHYHTKGDIVITEEDVATRKAATTKMLHVIQDYLFANPHVCA